jgi:hypothetical protein
MKKFLCYLVLLVVLCLICVSSVTAQQEDGVTAEVAAPADAELPVTQPEEQQANQEIEQQQQVEEQPAPEQQEEQPATEQQQAEEQPVTEQQQQQPDTPTEQVQVEEQNQAAGEQEVEDANEVEVNAAEPATADAAAAFPFKTETSNVVPKDYDDEEATRRVPLVQPTVVPIASDPGAIVAEVPENKQQAIIDETPAQPENIITQTPVSSTPPTEASTAQQEEVPLANEEQPTVPVTPVPQAPEENPIVPGEISQEHKEEMAELDKKSDQVDQMIEDGKLKSNQTRQIEIIAAEKSALMIALEQLEKAVEDEAKQAEEEYIRQRRETILALIHKKKAEVEDAEVKTLNDRAQRISSSLKILKAMKEFSIVPEHLIGRGHLMPAQSCKQIRDSNPNAKTGIFWLEPRDPSDKREKTPFRVFCLHVEQGGGWTLVAWKKAGVKLPEDTFGQEKDKVIMAFPEFRSQFKDRCNISAERLSVMTKTGFEVYIVEKDPSTGEESGNTGDAIMDVTNLAHRLNTLSSSALEEKEVSIYLRPM